MCGLSATNAYSMLERCAPVSMHFTLPASKTSDFPGDYVYPPPSFLYRSRSCWIGMTSRHGKDMTIFLFLRGAQWTSQRLSHLRLSSTNAAKPSQKSRLVHYMLQAVELNSRRTVGAQRLPRYLVWFPEIFVGVVFPVFLVSLFIMQLLSTFEICFI